MQIPIERKLLLQQSCDDTSCVSSVENLIFSAEFEEHFYFLFFFRTEIVSRTKPFTSFMCLLTKV